MFVRGYVYMCLPIRLEPITTLFNFAFLCSFIQTLGIFGVYECTDNLTKKSVLLVDVCTNNLKDTTSDFIRRFGGSKGGCI